MRPVKSPPEARPATTASAERLLLAAACTATLLVVLLAGRSRVGPFQRPWTFALVLWLWTLAAAVGAAAVLLPLVRLVDRRLRRTWSLDVVIGATAVYVIGMALALNRRAFVNLWTMEASGAHRWLSAAAAGFAALGLAASALGSSFRRVARLLALLAVGAFVTASWPRRPPPPPPSQVAALPPSTSGERILVVGIDGAGWNFIEPLIARGDLPHFEALRSRGSWGPLATLKPTLSPALWTTMATGCRPERHGIEDFSLPRLRGVDEPLPRLQPVRGLPVDRLPDALKRIGQVVDAPISSVARRVIALWNLATSQGSPMNVVTWFVTWPAEPVLGTMVSDRIYYYPAGIPREPGPVTFPPTLYPVVAPLVVRPEDVLFSDLSRLVRLTPAEYAAMRASDADEQDAAFVIRAQLAHYETTLSTALTLMERDRRAHAAPRDTLVYFPLVDRVQHRALQDWELGALPSSSPERARLFGRSVTEAYRLMDEALGRLLAAFGDGNVLVVSDHSFALMDRGGDRRYDHWDAPDGIWIAAGPAIAAGRRRRLSIYEVFPLLARLKGFPLSRALQARPPEWLLTPSFRDADPARWVDRYGARGAIPAPVGRRDVDGEMIEELRAVGYIQ
jgi:predicted AlkP superfamily phosphohydrolase/phosphomutase